MTNLKVMTPRHEWSVRELIEANLDELCRFCFYDETTNDIYTSNHTLETRLAAAYERLGGSAVAEFVGFELPLPDDVVGYTNVSERLGA